MKDIQYAGVVEPDFMKEVIKTIDDATIEELGLSEGTVLKDLPLEKQKEIAPIRQKNQELGFQLYLQSPEVIHRMSLGMAVQLTKEMKIIEHYDKGRKKNEKSLKKDAILNTVTHGMFPEALFLEAGLIKGKDGEMRKIEKDDIQTPEFGGFIMPCESFILEIGNDPENIPDKIPVTFEKDSRPADGVVLIDKKRLLELAEEYKQRRKPENTVK